MNHSANIWTCLFLTFAGQSGLMCSPLAIWPPSSSQKWLRQTCWAETSTFTVFFMPINSFTEIHDDCNAKSFICIYSFWRKIIFLYLYIFDSPIFFSIAFPPLDKKYVLAIWRWKPFACDIGARRSEHRNAPWRAVRIATTWHLMSPLATTLWLRWGSGSSGGICLT